MNKESCNEISTMIIKLYDNEDYHYPLIEINEDNFDDFKSELKSYQEDEMYNIDDFILLLKDKSWFIRTIYFDKEIFF